MKKMNNKGFLLVETIVVATFILTVLIVIFLQFKNLILTYNNSYNYNTVEGIYSLNAVKSYIVEYQDKDNTLNTQLKTLNVPYLTVYDGSCSMELSLSAINENGYCEKLMAASNFKTVIFADIAKLKTFIKTNPSNNVITEDMKNLIKRLKKEPAQSRLIAEFKDGTFASIVYDIDDAKKDEADDDKETKTCKNISDLKTIASSGIVADSNISGRYIYRGLDPNNYIVYGNSMWRIVSIESDNTIKIIKRDSMKKRAFDTIGKRTAGYCSKGDAPANGCNVFGQTSSFTSGTYNGEVSANSELNNYLNQDYYKTLGLAQNYINSSYEFNVGAVTKANSNLKNQVTEEQAKKWTGQVGLISLSDYINASSNTSKCNTFALNNANTLDCGSTNYIFNSIPSDDYLITLTPVNNSTGLVYYISSSGSITEQPANLSASFIPSVYLRSGLQVSGNGTSGNPYQICE